MSTNKWSDEFTVQSGIRAACKPGSSESCGGVVAHKPLAFQYYGRGFDPRWGRQFWSHLKQFSAAFWPLLGGFLLVFTNKSYKLHTWLIFCRHGRWQHLWVSAISKKLCSSNVCMFFNYVPLRGFIKYPVSVSAPQLWSISSNWRRETVGIVKATGHYIVRLLLWYFVHNCTLLVF